MLWGQGMKITRIVALVIIAASVGLTVGQSALHAQTLKSAGPPAEYPPASYQARQYVDSRGCVYIRAGIDGNVNWVPRVTRSRKQICGYKPTTVAGSTARPLRSAAPEQITLSVDPATQTPPSNATVPSVVNAPVPTATTRVRNAVPRVATAAPVVVTTAKPRRSAAAVNVTPSTPARRNSTTVQPVRQSNGVPSTQIMPPRYASAGQRQVQPARGSYRSSVLTPNSRIVPAHVYQQRRLSQGLTPPPGYRVAWDDGRLNIHRAERDLNPTLLASQPGTPAGYILVERGDDRMNLMRGRGSEVGDAQMATVWQAGVPRKLIDLPKDRQAVRLRNTRHDRFEGESKGALALRLSSRSEPGTTLVTSPKPNPDRYIRAATFADADQARRAARTLAAKGLPVRLGSVSRQGQQYKVVLAGPFSNLESARSALKRVRAAGHQGARISK